MLTIQRKGWLWTIAIVWAVGVGWAGPTADAQSDPMAQYAEFAREQASADAGTEFQVAQQTAAQGGVISGTTDQPATTQVPERIEVTFEEPEQDILTRAAEQKLDIMVESLEFANADLRNVIRIIGERLNLNFIFDANDIQGKVTLRLRNIRLRDALDSILVTRRLAIVADDSGIFRIVPQAQVGRSEIETRTEVIQLNWISALDVLETMRPFLSSDVGKMQANEESNTIIVTDVPPHIATIRGLIAQIDVPERQVMIEARLVDINIEALRTLGTQFSATHVRSQNSIIPTLIERFVYGGGVGSVNFGDQVALFGNEYDLLYSFQWLESRNIIQVLANPRVATLNNVPANIGIIQRVPYRQSTNLVSGAGATEQIAFEDVGVKIQVKPIITPNKFVRMEIQISQMIFRRRTSNDDPLAPPVIDTRDANTNVIVSTGDTAVLGGLRQLELGEGIDAIPWLHRIPFFGWLFKDKQHRQIKTELVLMMTPSIIDDANKMSERERELYGKIDADWHLPDYYFDDVKNPTDLKLDD
jgi:type IV pilus assembly protein PilQ